MQPRKINALTLVTWLLIGVSVSFFTLSYHSCGREPDKQPDRPKRKAPKSSYNSTYYAVDRYDTIYDKGDADALIPHTIGGVQYASRE